jgi:signal transduction histidine kinase
MNDPRPRLTSTLQTWRQALRLLLGRAERVSNRTLTIICGTVLLMVLLNGFVAYRSTRGLLDRERDVAHTHAVLTELERIVATLDDAETSQRGYVITGKVTYLLPYTTASEQIDSEIADLQAITADNPQAQQRIASLRPLIADKFAEMRLTIDLRTAGRTDDALQIIRSDEGERMMNQIRGQIATMRSTQSALLALRLESEREALSGTTITFVIAALTDVVLLGWVIYLVRRAIAQREQVAKEREDLLMREQTAREAAEAAVGLRDQFLSVASHELKTPLTALLGNAQILSRRLARAGVTLDERNQRTLTLIEQQALRLRKLIDDMLDVSRIERGQLTIAREPVDVAALARRVVMEAQAVQDKHDVVYEGSSEPVIVLGDEIRLEQVLQNLLQNAVKYSPEGGRITIIAESCDAQARLAVSDQGIGIPQASLPQLFERFYRAANVDPSHISGMGVGLYVSHEIVTQHGGSLIVSSEEGRGSTFAVLLPLASTSIGIGITPSGDATANVNGANGYTPSPRSERNANADTAGAPS